MTTSETNKRAKARRRAAKHDLAIREPHRVTTLLAKAAYAAGGVAISTLIATPEGENGGCGGDKWGTNALWIYVDSTWRNKTTLLRSLQ